MDRQQWANIGVGIGIALLSNVVLLVFGALIGIGEGSTPSIYWSVAGFTGAVLAIALIGGAVWGSIDNCRMNQPRHHTVTPHAFVLPHPR